MPTPRILFFVVPPIEEVDDVDLVGARTMKQTVVLTGASAFERNGHFSVVRREPS